MVKLNNWSIVGENDPYKAPELRKKYLQGKVFGHLQVEDGKMVTTSSIQSFSGRKVRTRNTLYVLGKIDPNYRKWLREHRPNWDWREPLTWID